MAAILVSHIFANDAGLPPQAGKMYEYVVGENGVFVRAERPGLRACAWVAATPEPIRGLAAVEPYVEIGARVPACLLEVALGIALDAAPNEILFYMLPDPWRLIIPDQEQASARCRPVDPYNKASQAALIDLHSHHDMSPFFSRTDDQDETGFRIYAVIGNIHTHPAIRARIGIYGHHWEIPAGWIFDLPDGVIDALYQPFDDTKMETTYDYSNSFIDDLA